MKVKIERCSAPIFWYRDYIGKIFEVEEVIDSHRTYRVLNPPKKAIKYIREKNVDWIGGIYICVEDCEDELFIAMRNIIEEKS